MTDTQLAEALCAIIPPPDPRRPIKERNDYLIRINHPAIAPLYAAFKREHMIGAQHPPSDYLRLLFELTLLGAAAKATIARELEHIPRTRPEAENLDKRKSAETL